MLQEMILQNRNHSSIILWGVRINESMDDDAFYNRTNKIAHQLDPSRATSGVRYHRRAAGNAGALFLHVPTPWNSKQARPAGLACLQYQKINVSAEYTQGAAEDLLNQKLSLSSHIHRSR